jgi:23S rRNA (adenine1618-N6)-methyltransferase
MHPRNRHAARYDFPQLIAANPELASFLTHTPTGEETVDFTDPAAVKALNKALLKQFYNVQHWDIPAGYLCPPIPGRADYIHHAADLLATVNGGVVPGGKSVHVLDIGVGANCVYPILGTREYNWRFVGADIDPVAIRAAKHMVAANPALTGRIDLRLQPHKASIFDDVVKPREEFDLTVCNPPFHASAAEAAASNQRKNHNLGHAQALEPSPNFGGKNTELWYEGGEEAFVRLMVEQSVPLASRVLWFTSLISKKETLPSAYHFLKQAGALDVQTIPMSQGQKVSRLVAWTFQDEAQQQAWRTRRWQPREVPTPPQSK